MATFAWLQIDLQNIVLQKMDKTKIRTMRLKKQQISLEKQPLENALVKRQQDLKFYYCLYNLEDDYKHGFYFGLLQLHPSYPFAAPKLFMYTPNGRYECNLAICTSFTNYHQQSWTSAWNVRTLIKATISFMYSNEPSFGCRTDPSESRKKYARESLTWNMQNQQFRNLFGQAIVTKLPELIKMGIHIYDRKLCQELKKLGLFQMNKQNLNLNNQQKIQHNYNQNHRAENRREINKQPQVQIQNIQQNQIELLGDDQERQRIRKQQQKKRQEQQKKKRKKILYAVLGLAGCGILILIYINFGNSSSNSQQTPSLTSLKPLTIFEYLAQPPKKFIGIIKGWLSKIDQVA